MSVLFKPPSQTAIYRLSISLLVFGCTRDNKEAIVGIWNTPVRNGGYGVIRFLEQGSLLTWAEPKPPEGSNLGRSKYFTFGDSIGLVGDLSDTITYAVNWIDRDHVELINSVRTISLTRRPE